MYTLDDIRPDLLHPSHLDGHPETGVFSYIARSPELAQILARAYGREGLCLKMFKRDAQPLDEFYWGDTGNLLTDCTKAQNLFALEGFAPRVYDIALVNGTHWAQVTDYVTDDGGKFDRAACRTQVVDRYQVRTRGGDQNPANWIGSQMVDFQHHFVHPAYEVALKRRCTAGAAWGARSDAYQAAGLAMDSQRTNAAERARAMGWDEVDFAGATVLDVGCNLGEMCQEAHDRGARRVVGVDLPHVAKLAYEVANWRSYWNLDFVGAQLPSGSGQIAQQTGIDVFDIVLALSAKQTRPDPWAFALCKRVCFFEGHVPDREETWRPVLERRFERVEFLGATRDHGVRPVFRCWR